MLSCEKEDISSFHVSVSQDTENSPVRINHTTRNCFLRRDRGHGQRRTRVHVGPTAPPARSSLLLPDPISSLSCSTPPTEPMQAMPLRPTGTCGGEDAGEAGARWRRTLDLGWGCRGAASVLETSGCRWTLEGRPRQRRIDEEI